MKGATGSHSIAVGRVPVVTATYPKYGCVIGQIGLAPRRLRAVVWGCITLTGLLQGLLTAQVIPAFHLVSREDCGNPLRSAHLVEKNMSGVEKVFNNPAGEGRCKQGAGSSRQLV